MLKKIATLLLGSIFFAQVISIPSFALDSTDSNIIQNNQYTVDLSEDSSFTLKNAQVEVSDDYAMESDYISEVQISDSSAEPIISESTEPEMATLTDYPGDDMVYLTQRWLNQEYGDVEGFGTVTEDGKTGWNVVYGLLRALQHELGITSLANSFGPSTSALYSQNLLYRQDGVIDRKFAILQGALWCKGYCPGYNLYEADDGTIVFNGVFNADVEAAVIELKTDAGFINPNGVVTLNVMKALMSMDSFKLLSSYGGTAEVRAMQQKLNRKYEEYTGLTPCDGVYGRNTNKALIYALQAEELLPTSVANGNFGNTTKLCCPEIPYAKNSTSARTYPGTSAGSLYTTAQISAITELLQFSLLVNGYDVGVIDGVFDTVTQAAIRNFQKEMAIPVTGKADIGTWMSLLISKGDTSRSAIAADCATILTTAKAETLYDNGYRYIGRYLTGTYNGGISKAITRDEADIIFDAGLKFFPIYQTSANYLDYFTVAQGAIDEKEATQAARNLGLPKNTIIYFAVDFDCLDYEITSNVIPYFRQLHAEMQGSGYKVGIYGTRNACTRVSELGYACSSFVGDMSTGFSGNLGFGMPANWAFDQFHTITIGSGEGQIEIDKNGYSGRDPAVSELDPVNISISPEDINIGNTASDTLTGPTINILGYNIPLFSLDVGLDINGLINLETEYDSTENEYKVLIGYDIASMSTETGGNNTRIGKFNKAYVDVKTTYSAIGKNNQEFSRRFNDIKGSLFQKGTKIGFDCDSYMFGYMTVDCSTGKLTEGGVVIVGTVEKSISYMLVPCVYAKFAIEGSMEAGFALAKEESGTIGFEGSLNFGITPKLSVGVDVLVASAYAGISGTLSCGLDFPIESFSESFSVNLSAAVFFEYQALLWGNCYEWEFANVQLYPSTNTVMSMSINNDDLKFIEPTSETSIVNRTSTSDVLNSNVQVYCSPKIINLGNGKMFMVYIVDSSNRTDTNRTMLMYRIYDGTSWSNAQPVLDDGTADFEPAICPDGNGGAHIIWQNCNNILESNVTLETMSTQMDIYYTHWNGSSFDNTTSITNNNNNYEMAHKIVSNGSNISIVWQKNSVNDVFALEGTNSIYRKQKVNGTWGSVETISTGLSVVTSLETSYFNNNNVIAYTAKTNANNSDISDLEVFYYNGNNVTRITNDTIPDYSISLLENELYWISGNTLVSIENGNIDTKEIVSELDSNVTEIKALKNSNNKAIVWQYENDIAGNFYGVIYNEELDIYSSPKPLLTDSGLIRGWDACINSNGQIEMIYGFAEKLDEPVDQKPYSQIDLMQKSSNEFYDVAVDLISTYTGTVLPEEEIIIKTNVYNNGSADISNLTVNILNSNDEIVNTISESCDLPVGSIIELDIPFTLPSNLIGSTYKIQVLPSDEIDIFTQDNLSTFTVGLADLTISSVNEERSDSGRNLIIKVKNNGYTTINTATFKLYKNSVEKVLLSTNTISQLQPNQEAEFTYFINNAELDSSVSQEARSYYISVETSESESNYGNNDKFVYIYPDYNITLNAGMGGSVSGGGIYEKDASVTLTATANAGYIFDGWYENNKLIHAVGNKYTISVDRNRNIEARFRPNDLQITYIEVFGMLEVGENISFTATASGGVQPWEWDFYVKLGEQQIYSNETSMVNFFEWTPSVAGTYTILAYVTDATGVRVSNSTQVVIS